MDTVALVIDAWRAAGVQLNPGASSASLGRLQSALGVPLPPDVTAFFSAADGMADSEAVADLANFWSIDRLLSQRLEREGQDRGGAYRDLAFADVMIGSWCLWFRMRPPEQLSIFVEGSNEEQPSFTAALDRYVAVAKGARW